MDDSLCDALKAYNQEHVVKHWDELSLKEQVQLNNDVKAINLEELTGFVARALSPPNNGHTNNIDQLMKPVPPEHFGTATDPSSEDVKRWEAIAICCKAAAVAFVTIRRIEEALAVLGHNLPDECLFLLDWLEDSYIGLEEISHSRIAVILLAGGQGTRLGVKYPKGMYDVGLPSGKTLYQLQAERIRRLEQLALERTNRKGSIVWYIMTSEATKKQTSDFFEERDYFGLASSNVVFFEQFTLPCVDFNRKIILQTKGKIATAPDGNGGLYRALREHGILDDMGKRGIQATHVYCVDNILVKMADPVFIGFCHQKGADCGAKVVEKTHPDEAVGVVCLVDDVYQVVEYSEISKETASKRTETGKLMFSAGNICNHFFTLPFLKNVCSREQEIQLHHHVAKKKIPFLNKNGETVTPTSPNGVKMEKFVFDVFKFSERFAVLEVLREDEFSPLKNADTPDGRGGDSNPRTSRWALMSLHHRLVASAGGKVTDQNSKVMNPEDCKADIDGEYPVQVEISPLFSYSGEGLESIVTDKPLTSPVHLT